jgi:mediator of RNA polymerase II transcription subunit 6
MPLADYYIIAGHVYQAPDLGSVINSRVLNVIHHLESALDESLSFARFHPSKGYWWEFASGPQGRDGDGQDKKSKAGAAKKAADEGSSLFQRQRVDVLLAEWSRNFPPRIRAQRFPAAPVAPAPQQQVMDE